MLSGIYPCSYTLILNIYSQDNSSLDETNHLIKTIFSLFLMKSMFFSNHVGVINY